jgi:hypothetical protein
MFSGVSSLSTRDDEGTGHCGSGVFIGEELDGVGDKGSGNITMADERTLIKELLKGFQAWSLSIQIKGIIL